MTAQPDEPLQPDDREPTEPTRSSRWGFWDRLGVIVVAVLVAVVGVVVVSEASKGPSSLELAAWHEAGHAVVGDLAPEECGIVIQRLHVTREGSGAVNFSRDGSRESATGDCQWADLLLVVAGEEAGDLYADLQAAPEQAASDKSSALQLVGLLRLSRPEVSVDDRLVDWDADTDTILATARVRARQILDENVPAVRALAEAVLAEDSLNLGRERIRTIIDGAQTANR